MFVAIMRKLTNYVIIFNNKVPPFVSRVPWFGKRNNFIRLASKGIGRLVQSGIYDLWARLLKQSKLMAGLRKVDAKLNSIGRQNYFAFFVLSKLKWSSQALDMSAISLQTVDFVFMACGVVLFFSVVAFLVEMGIFHKLSKSTTVMPFVP